MPLLEAPDTTESSEPSGTAGATTPGTGTLAGAWMASAGTLVPSGRVWFLSAEDALALELTRLAVHTPESSARGTSAIALLLRDKVLAVMRVVPSQRTNVPSAPSADRWSNDPSTGDSRRNPRCDVTHTAPVAPRRMRVVRIWRE